MIETLKLSMTSNESDDYLITASGFYRNQVVYSPYKAFDNDISGQWFSTENVTQNWIQIEFKKEPLMISKLFLVSTMGTSNDINAMIKKGKFQGSNDGVNYIDLIDIENQTNWGTSSTRSFSVEKNKNIYKYYRLFFIENNGSHFSGIGEMYFEYEPRGKILLKSNNKIYSLKSEETLYETKMTSNTTPAPFVASASSVYSSTHPAWKAFNGTTLNVEDSWLSANGKVKDEWIQIDFASTKKVNAVKINHRVNSHTVYMIKDFDILGSNDGVNFNLLGNIKNQSAWSAGEKRIFYVSESNYRYYRIRINENNGGAFVHIGDILFSYIQSLKQLPSDSVDSHINYGSSSIENFNLINTNKNYILQDGVSEDTDGLWKQELSRKPLTIKFEK